MNIHYFSCEEWEEAFVRAKLPNETITFYPDALSAHPDLADASAEVLCVFMDSPITLEVLNRFPSVKLVATRSTGFDHVDLTAAKARGVTVVNVPFYGENTVAEFTFALLLALSRRVIDADERVRSGVFSPKELRGFDLEGKTLGVVGGGHIGMHVIRIAKGFGMKILCFDAHPNQELAHELTFAYASLPDLLAESDVVTLHVPYNEHTHHLLNAEAFKQMKKGAYLVNTARGAVVDTEALVAALKDGTLAGAALDVLEEEGDLADEAKLFTSAHPNEERLKTLLADHYLINHPRVIVTPHAAFNTQEAVERIISTTVDNIHAFEGGTPTNLVPLP